MPFLIQQETTRAVDQLISRQALLSEASRMGLRVSPEEVKDELQHGRYAATFFPGGSFHRPGGIRGHAAAGESDAHQALKMR